MDFGIQASETPCSMANKHVKAHLLRSKNTTFRWQTPCKRVLKASISIHFHPFPWLTHRHIAPKKPHKPSISRQLSGAAQPLTFKARRQRRRARGAGLRLRAVGRVHQRVADDQREEGRLEG